MIYISRFFFKIFDQIRKFYLRSNFYDKKISKINNKVYSPIYFLMGEETYYIDLFTELLEKNILSEEEKSFNQTVLYGKDTSVDEIISVCKRFPMMSEYQLVIVKEAQDLDKNGMMKDQIKMMKNQMKKTNIPNQHFGRNNMRRR